MKNKQTRFLGLGLVACLAIGLIGCGKSSSNTTTYEPLPEEDTTMYKIGIISSADNTYYNAMQEGFVTALKDTIGAEHLEITEATIDDEHDGESICHGFLADDVNLIYADGKNALVSSSIATMETPIVATGVYDFQTTLHIISSGTWDRTTGRNITGITAFPAIAEQLSLLIEATPQLDAVGLLYVAGDTDAIYQNELLERYLNQAGIPWKEYEIQYNTDTTPEDADEADTEEDADSDEEAPATTVRGDSVITPMDIVKASGKEGANTNVSSIGQTSIITGLLSHDSVRTAKVSDRWTSYKNDSYRALAQDILTVLKKEDCDRAMLSEAFPQFDREQLNHLLENRETLTEDDLTAQLIADSSANTLSYENGNTTEEILAQAASECSAFYFSAGSSLAQDIETITSIAHDNGVTTVSGDTEIGAYTLVNFYTDPFDMGYRAGKQAYRILVDGEDPAEIKVGLPNASDFVKLYNSDVAEEFEMTFPKSFSDFKEYLSLHGHGEANTEETSES